MASNVSFLSLIASYALHTLAHRFSHTARFGGFLMRRTFTEYCLIAVSFVARSPHLSAKSNALAVVVPFGSITHILRSVPPLLTNRSSQ